MIFLTYRPCLFKCVIRVILVRGLQFLKLVCVQTVFFPCSLKAGNNSVFDSRTSFRTHLQVEILYQGYGLYLEKIRVYL